MANAISTVERHPNRNAIISKMMAGVPLRQIAADFDISPQALSRFKRNTLQKIILSGKSMNYHSVDPDIVSTVKEVRSIGHTMPAAASTASYVDRKLERYGKVLALALEKGDPSAWASVDRAETAALQLRADLLGERTQAQAANVQVAILIPSPGAVGSDDDDGQPQ